MGGHGGLNILPQKRWNVYRRDNRAKVARDEAEDKRRNELLEQQRRAAALNTRIDRLKSRDATEALAIIAASLESTDVKERDEEPAVLSLPHEETMHHVMLEESQQRIKENRHINLFDDAEKLCHDVENKHSKYLSEIGHSAMFVSDFDIVSKGAQQPWYLRPSESNPAVVKSDVVISRDEEKPSDHRGRNKRSRKKTIEELRAARLEREASERKRLRC